VGATRIDSRNSIGRNERYAIQWPLDPAISNRSGDESRFLFPSTSFSSSLLLFLLYCEYFACDVTLAFTASERYYGTAKTFLLFIIIIFIVIPIIDILIILIIIVIIAILIILIIIILEIQLTFMLP
jgi:hypothetical protein